MNSSAVSSAHSPSASSLGLSMAKVKVWINHQSKKQHKLIASTKRQRARDRERDREGEEDREEEREREGDREQVQRAVCLHPFEISSWESCDTDVVPIYTYYESKSSTEAWVSFV